MNFWFVVSKCTTGNTDKLQQRHLQDFEDFLEGWVQQTRLYFLVAFRPFCLSCVLKPESWSADQASGVLRVCLGASDWCEEYSWQRWHISLLLPPSPRRWSRLSQTFQNSTFSMHPLNALPHWKQMTVEARKGKNHIRHFFSPSGWG